MGILVTEGYARGFLASMGYGGGMDIPPVPPPSERIPVRSRLLFPIHAQPSEEYSYELFPQGHRVKPFRLLTAQKLELQARYRKPHFVIQKSEDSIFEGAHEPGLELKVSDLVAYFSFDGETEAERLHDRTPNGKNLSLSGSSLPTFITGQFGDALFCNIEGDSAALTNLSLFPDVEGGFSAFGLTSWLAVPPLFDQYGTEIQRPDSSQLFYNYQDNLHFDITVTNDRRIQIQLYSDEDHKLVWLSDYPIFTTAFFHHFAFTYRKAVTPEGDVTIPVMKIYVDKEEKSMSLYQADEGAPMELLSGGTTVIGRNSGLIFDELRVYSHDLSAMEVYTDYLYKSRTLVADDFSEPVLNDSIWSVSPDDSVVVSDERAVFQSAGAILASNFLARSKMFTNRQTFSIRGEGASEGLSTLKALLKDGSTEISLQFSCDVKATTLDLIDFTVGWGNVDGDATSHSSVFDEWDITDLEKKEYLLTVFFERRDTGVYIHVEISRIGDDEETVVVLAKTYLSSVRVSGDYGFVAEASLTVLDGDLIYSVKDFQTRSIDNLVTYTPASFTEIIPPAPPVIVTPPSNQSKLIGETATFSVVASGDGTLTYQWKKNNVDIPLATLSSYTTPATALTDSGDLFKCVVTNLGGSTTSAEATLTVTRNEDVSPASPLVLPFPSYSDLFTPEDGETGVLSISGAYYHPSYGFVATDASTLSYPPPAQLLGSNPSIPFSALLFDYSRAGAVVTVTPQTTQPPAMLVSAVGTSIRLGLSDTISPTRDVPPTPPYAGPFPENIETDDPVDQANIIAVAVGSIP